MPTVYDTEKPICPIGAPSRDFSHHRRPPQKVAPKPRPNPSSSRSNRPQGMVFSEDDLPQDLQKIVGAKISPAPPHLPFPREPRATRGMGILFNVNELPQELKQLKGDGSDTKPA